MQDEHHLEQKRKRSLFELFVYITLAAFAVLTIVNYLEGDLSEIVLNIFVMLFMAGGLVAIRKWNKDLMVYRIEHFFICLVFFYGVARGTGKGTVLFWVLIMPLLFFYFFGKKEGLLWTMVFAAGVCLIALCSPMIGGFSYGPALIPRFLIILLIIIIVGYGLESSRDTYSRLLMEKNNELLREKELLEKAAGEIKTLSGLIPICCHCKKIRDDQGYWQQVEIYVQDRTDADFSHGICPECAEKFYPGYIKQSLPD